MREIIWVDDYFSEEQTGGAELTSKALIDESPFKIQKVKSIVVNEAMVRDNDDKLWIFGNFAHLKYSLIELIVQYLDYVVIEYDYKYCMERLPQLCEQVEGVKCDCANGLGEAYIAPFMRGALMVYFMSVQQQTHYVDLFDGINARVLSSVLDEATLNHCAELRKNTKKNHKTAILGSGSWVKNVGNTVSYCEHNDIDYELLGRMPYERLLKTLAGYEKFLYMPQGYDTCPRITIEAKLLGCSVILGDYVQHREENWYSTIETIEDHMKSRPKEFWNEVIHLCESTHGQRV